MGVPNPVLWLPQHALSVCQCCHGKCISDTCPMSLQETVAAINRFSFQQFGGTALALSCVPIVGLLLFSWTHTVGAALWAADLERKGVSLLEIDAASTKKS